MKTFASMATIPHSGIKTMSDRGVRVSVDTQELSIEDMATLFQFKGGSVKFVLAQEDAKITEEDIKITDEIVPKGKKTESQRLRAVIYRLWEQSRQDKTSEEFYQIQMERIIEKLKEQL